MAHEKEHLSDMSTCVHTAVVDHNRDVSKLLSKVQQGARELLLGGNRQIHELLSTRRLVLEIYRRASKG